MSILDGGMSFLSKNLKNPPQYFPGNELIIIPLLLMIAIPVLIIWGISRCFNQCFHSNSYPPRPYTERVYTNNYDYNSTSWLGNLFSWRSSPYVGRNHYYHNVPSEPYIAPCNRGRSSYLATPSEPFVAPSSHTRASVFRAHSEPFVVPSSNIGSSFGRSNPFTTPSSSSNAFFSPSAAPVSCDPSCTVSSSSSFNSPSCAPSMSSSIGGGQRVS